MRPIVLAIFVFFYIFSFPVAAQETTSTSSAESSIKTIHYPLPYPGILPTSPIYPFKMLRDRIIGYLIADPLKKSEFLLLQADKRLQAGVTLLLRDKSHSTLALSTISKGENYFSESLDEVMIAKKQDRDIYDMGVKLSVAARKHEETLLSIDKSVPSSERENYEKELGRVREYIKRAKPLMIRESSK